MSRLIRFTAVLLPAALTVSVLAACGSTKAGYGDTTVTGFSAAKLGGDYGKTPTLQWVQEPAYPASTQVQTITQGTGAAVGATSVDLHIYIADPIFDLNKAATACDSSSASPSASTAPTPSEAPSASGSSSPIPSPVPIQTCAAPTYPMPGSWAYSTAAGKYDSLIVQAGTVWSTILAGAKVGSRIEALAGSDQVFPASASSDGGDPGIGIGTHDPLLVVVDVMRITPVSPTPSDAKAHTVSPSTMPKVFSKNGKPVAFNWAGIAKPSLTTPVQVAILKKGTGAPVKSTDTVTVNYFGETYQAKKPFDESYVDKTTGKPGTPLTQALSGLVKGWGIGLAGIPVGSRVMLQIPPFYGYGATAQNGIPGNSTMWFVIDIIKATKGS